MLAAGPASAFSAACTACSTALVQCSIRGESPCQVCDPGHIAGRIHVWRSFTEAVADDAVVEREPTVLEPLRVWSDADAHHHHICLDSRAVRERDPGYVRLAEDIRYSDASAKVYPVVAVHGPDHLAECRPQGWGERDSDSITVTCKPRARQEAATSRPMNPAPTMATRGAFVSSDRSAIASSRPRKTSRPPVARCPEGGRVRPLR